MHHPTWNSKSSLVWKVVLVLFLIGIVAVHLVGIAFLSKGVLPFMYLGPVLLAVSLLVVWHIWRMRSKTGTVDVGSGDIVSQDGLHWHPEIAIFVKGVKQEIPQTGVTNMDMSAMHHMHKKMRMKHMHEGSNEQGVIHLKFEGTVRESDITLSKIFEKWGKDIHSFGSNVKMTVNGKENTEYENYVMQDKDKVELYYE